MTTRTHVFLVIRDIAFLSAFGALMGWALSAIRNHSEPEQIGPEPGGSHVGQ